MEIIKLSLFGIMGVLLATQFKGIKSEFNFCVGVAVALLIFFYAVNSLTALISELGVLQKYLKGGESYLGTLLKIVGITYICEFSSGICKDAGFGSVAGQIEVLGKLAVMFAGLPILLAVLEQIQGFM